MPRLISTYKNQNEENQAVWERPSPEGGKERKQTFR